MIIRDYGIRGVSRHGWIWPAVVCGGSAAASVYVLAMAMSGYRDLTAERAYWKVAGPSCPRLTGAAFRAQPMRPVQTFRFQGVAFARAYGWANCAERPEMGGLRAAAICEFTNPGVLAVDAGAGEVYFAPGVGQLATVSAHDGKPECVLGSNFR